MRLRAKAASEAIARAAAEASAKAASEAIAKAAAEASAKAAAEAIAKAAAEASAKAASAPAEIFELEKPAAPHSVPEAAEEEFILDVSDAAPVVVEPEPLPLPKMAASAPAHPVEPVHTPPPKAAEPAEDILGDFVLDLEESRGSDFMAAGPPQTCALD